MGEPVIRTQDLTKRYGNFTAVERLNLTVESGEVFGLLGPNGAGKTTTILMLLGLTEPTAGSVRVLGFDPVRQPLSVKSRVGYIPEQVGFYDDLTARENLVYIARLNGLPRIEASSRIDEVLERMGLRDVADQRVATYSRGMLQRLGVAEVLLKRPSLIIMDEPTQGLDPEGARDFLGIIGNLKAQGITVLLSSHLLHQVQAVCDRVGLFYRGQVVLEGTVHELAQRVLGGGYKVHLEAEGLALMEALQRLPEVIRVHHPQPRHYIVEVRRDLRAEVSRAVLETGGALLSLHLEEPSLDEVYARYFEEVEHGSRS